MAESVARPAIHALEEMFARDWSLGDLCRAMGADATDRLALEMLFLVDDPSIRLGEMAEKLDRAFGVSEGFFKRIEDAWIGGQGKS